MGWIATGLDPLMGTKPRLCSTQLVIARSRPCRLHRLVRQHLNLPDQKALLVRELLVVSAVVEERRQELEQLFAVVDEDLLHGDGFVGVGDKYLGCQRASYLLRPLTLLTLNTWNAS
jgi:hypothetical protein